MLDGPHIETDRLLLRPPRMEDFADWAAAMTDPETTRFIGGVQAASEAWRGLMSVAGAWALTGVSFFSVIERSSGRWVGRVGPWAPEGWPGTEVGWTLSREFRGRGYAVEAATAAIDFAFDQLGWSEVIHTIDPQNIASQNVARRLGAQRIGPGALPPPYQDSRVEIWGQSRAAWKDRAA
jgi:RimJ/RimL family protein N-acetyltransferase